MKTRSGLWVAMGVALSLCGGLPASAQGTPAAGVAGVPWAVVRRTLPGGAPGASVIDLEQTLPREVRQGQPFDYRLRVANQADCPLAEVSVVQRLPAGVTLVGSSPQAEVRDGIATWRLGTLAVHESRLIQGRAVTSDTGAMTFCCDTLYRAPLCMTVASTRPELLLSLEMPAEGTPCDLLPVQVGVRNSGTGQCHDVRVQIQLPDGLNGADGRRQYAIQVGNLAAGEARRSQLVVQAQGPGSYQTQASAVCADGPRADAVAETRIVAPRLTIVQTGTDQQYAGRDVVYTFSVRNDGDTVARNVVVEDTVPSGVSVAMVKPEAVLAADAGRVVWRLAALPAGGVVDFALTVRSAAAGSFANQVTARADCAQDVGALHAAQVNGIAAILLEVIDQDDPIEVGGRDTYVITATNQGTAPCTNLVIQCILEDNVQHVASEGPTTATLPGTEVVFAPLAELAPKGTAVWKVVVAALKPGDVRFRVLLTGDQLTRPVEETESTRLY